MCEGGSLAPESSSSPRSFVHLDTLSPKPLPPITFVFYTEPELAKSSCPAPEDNLGTNLEGGLSGPEPALAFHNPLMPSHSGRVPRPVARTPRRLCPDGSQVASAPRPPPPVSSGREAGLIPCPAAAAPLGRLSCGGVILPLHREKQHGGVGLTFNVIINNEILS